MVYNPLDKKNLGVSVRDAMLAQPISALPPENAFVGAGIYAIYYAGDYEHYQRIAAQNIGDAWEQPIYVGKAIPAGARRGGLGLDAPTGNVLFKRLREHADSIAQSPNLHLADFACRFLVVDDIWIPLGESLLIESFSSALEYGCRRIWQSRPGSGKISTTPFSLGHFASRSRMGGKMSARTTRGRYYSNNR